MAKKHISAYSIYYNILLSALLVWSCVIIRGSEDLAILHNGIFNSHTVGLDYDMVHDPVGVNVYICDVCTQEL